MREIVLGKVRSGFDALPLGKIVILIWGFVLIYFVYIGVTTKPWEGDSLAYHIPIARLIQRGKIFGPEVLSSPFLYYPATGETLLAGMETIFLPLNLFNVVGWILLFLLCRKLGGTIFATAIVLLPSAIRLLSTQTVDIWLAVFWLGSWWALVKRPSVAGLLLGLLSGTKYSGLLYAGVLWLFFSRQISWQLIVGWLVGGGYWYVRNWAWMGNPIYPASLGPFKGDVEFKLLGWQAWMTLVSQPVRFVSALVSEYLAWPLALLSVVNSQVRRLWGLAIANLVIYLLLPSWPVNTVSDLRYAYPAFIPLILAAFRTWPQAAEIVTILSGVAVMTQLDYHPKLFVVYIAAIGLWILRKNWARSF